MNGDPTVTAESPQPMTPDVTPVELPGMEEPIEVEPEGGTLMAPVSDVGNLMFEDFFPPLDLSEDKKKSIAEWLLRDLKACVRNVKDMENDWALYRAVYALEYVEKFYPSMGMSANFSSGLLCEKVLEGMDRLRMGIFSPRPMFVVDDRTSNVEDVGFIHRAEWFMQTVLEDDLEIEDVIGMLGLFEFLLDGSMILESDMMYENIPQRTIKTYTTTDGLLQDADKVISQSDLDNALVQIEAGQPARVLIEQDVITKNGLQFFRVDKRDHLIPPGVYEDRDIRFRGRRMYMTESDLMLLSSEGVNWYDRDDVNEVLNVRKQARITRSLRNSSQDLSDDLVADELNREQTRELSYDWQGEEDTLGSNTAQAPYRNTFAVYRVLAKYGYKTRSDPKGLIPKYCLFDIEPDSRKILRYRTFPHFHEHPNYFHFKVGVKPKSYWGFGYGPRLLNEDFLESNAVDLVLDAAAYAAFKPMLTVHPDEGGIIPFQGGIGPYKLGYVRNPNDFKELDINPPPTTLLNVLLPLTQDRASNRTSVTPLSQGRPESSDPRSPAAKTAMLLREGAVGIDSIIKDWNRAWEAMARFIWKAEYEVMVYEGKDAFEDKIVFPGMDQELESTNTITLEELGKNIKWKSQAASDYLNSEIREQKFLREFQFFAPQIQMLARVNPQLFVKYFGRWMNRAAQEMNIRGFRYLVPTVEELQMIPPQEAAQSMSDIFTQMRSGQSPEQVDIGGAGESQASAGTMEEQ